jgi:hypothetical protein
MPGAEKAPEPNVIAALIALSLQAAAPAPADDSARLSAIDHVWIVCRREALDGFIASARADEEVVAAAFAACAAQEEAVRAELVRQFGQARGNEGMTYFRRISRGAMMDRVRQARGR